MDFKRKDFNRAVLKKSASLERSLSMDPPLGKDFNPKTHVIP